MKLKKDDKLGGVAIYHEGNYDLYFMVEGLAKNKDRFIKHQGRKVTKLVDLSESLLDKCEATGDKDLINLAQKIVDIIKV